MEQTLFPKPFYTFYTVEPYRLSRHNHVQLSGSNLDNAFIDYFGISAALYCPVDDGGLSDTLLRRRRVHEQTLSCSIGIVGSFCCPACGFPVHPNFLLFHA